MTHYLIMVDNVAKGSIMKFFHLKLTRIHLNVGVRSVKRNLNQKIIVHITLFPRNEKNHYPVGFFRTRVKGIF